MCDIVDFMYHKQKSFINNKYVQSQLNEKIVASCELPKVTNFKKPEQIYNQPKTIKFAALNSIWSIILLIFQENHKMNLVFKLHKNTEILRIHTNFLKNYLIGKLMKENNFPFVPRINPLTGEISISIQVLIHNHQQSLDLQQLDFFTKTPTLKKRIIEFWKTIICLAEGEFGIEQNFITTQKANEIKMMALMTDKQNQAENVYNFKNYLTNHQQKQNDIISDFKHFFPHDKQENKQIENFPYRKCLLQVFKQKKCLQLESIRPMTKFSNFQVLNINKKSKDLLFDKIRKLQGDQVLRVQDNDLGKLFLTVQQQTKEIKDKLAANLSQVNKSNEHNFLNYYFVLQDSPRQCLLKMALKKLTLKNFLQKNINCISAGKKLEIFTQIFHVVQQIWERFRMFPGYFNIMDFSITKTHSIKFQSIQKWRMLDVEDQSQKNDENLAFYKKQMLIRLYKILRVIIFNSTECQKNKSCKNKSNSVLIQCLQSQMENKIISEKGNELHLYGIPEILSPVIYCLQKYEMDLIKTKELNQKQINPQSNVQKQIRKNLKKGNLDLILGTLVKSIELNKLIS